MVAKNEVPTVTWHVQLPAWLSAILENEMLDPVTMKPKYGAKSQLVTDLLETYAREHGFFDRVPKLQPTA